MIIDFKVIPHRKMRYPSVGDWYWKRDRLVLRVSRMSDRRYEWLVALHELIECLLCKLMDVTQTSADRFDIAYEKARERGAVAPCGCVPMDEPGNDLHAPYHRQHRVATQCEVIMALLLDVNWRKYNAEVQSL